MDDIRGRLLMPELVQRNPCPLRPAFAQDGEMQCSRRDGGDAEYDTPLVFPRISGLAAQDRLIYQPVSVLGNAFIHGISFQQIFSFGSQNIPLRFSNAKLLTTSPLIFTSLARYIASPCALNKFVGTKNLQY